MKRKEFEWELKTIKCSVKNNSVFIEGILVNKRGDSKRIVVLKKKNKKKLR